MLEKICEEATRLTGEEISQLKAVARWLPLIAELIETDVFLDCMTAEDCAVVVAHAKPVNRNSLYEKNVVGEKVYSDKEPAVFHAFRDNAPVRNLKAQTQENRVVLQNVIPIRNAGEQVFAVLIREADISQELRAQEKLKTLTESTDSFQYFQRIIAADGTELTSAREAYHRIKNNLQIVVGVMRLQMRKYKGTVTEDVLKGNVSLLLAIADLNDMLSQKKNDFSNVSSQMLLRNLKKNISCLIPEGKKIEIEVLGDDATISSGQAEAVALVVHELLINALKYAFVDRDSGSIKVFFYAGPLYHRITVCDNGRGYDVKSAQGNGLGSSIVDVVVRDKLKGRLSRQSDNRGTHISFDFRNETPSFGVQGD